ncbi:hypothetical protein B0H66DRAFT_613321 [Apodospora peruviana]|uniref:Kinesin light chain n=1 Tax=Apodospora peruviana TaxID=516989 RepID=A0AAE0MG18_9PEZI|nr:hypothetical protein B0H66DRAFT_613321 [Apodospora peruviana]
MPLGFHCLHNVRRGVAPEDKLVDIDWLNKDDSIVAVHDVGEDSYEAWTDPKTGALWLRDFLPDEIQVARVLAYGYDSSASTLFADDAPEKIQRMAESFVQELRADRHFAGSLRRPIIFVCHGMGGVLVKKSLIYSSTRTAPKVAHLWDQFVSTFAILFFATPHGHTVKSNWLEFEARSAPTRTNSFPHLRRSKHTNERTSDPQLPRWVDREFAPLVKQFHMFFFWEQLETPLGQGTVVLVDHESAAPSLDNTESAGITATHSEIAKFHSRESSEYRMVLSALMGYCEKAPDIIAHRWRQAEVSLKQMRLGEAREIGGFAFDVHLEEPFQHRDIHVHRHFHLPEETTPAYIGRGDMLNTLHNAFFPGGYPTTEPGQKSFVVFGTGYTTVFTIYAASPETIKESYSTIGELAGLQPTENAGRHFLSQQTESWLLIIDNADDGSMNLRRLFPSGNAAHILVTTRNRDFAREGTLGSLEVKGLREEEAVQLLLTKADIPRPWDASVKKMASIITKALGHLALALIQAGTCVYRGVCELADYLEIHSSARRRLQGKGSSQHERSGNAIVVVYSTFDVSLGLLLKQPLNTPRQDAGDLLRILGFFHFEFIPLEIFSRAVANREKALRKPDQATTGSWVSGLLDDIMQRLRPPTVLPGFLKPVHGELDKYRINWAIAELQSSSFIRCDGKYISLHPLIHAWARDTLTISQKHTWASIAMNTLMTSVSLPPDSSSEADGRFHRDILPHLDACMAEHGNPLSQPTTELSSLRLRVARVCQPTLLLIISDQIQQHAKFGEVRASRYASPDGKEHAGQSSRRRRRENHACKARASAGVYWGLGRLEESITLQDSVVRVRTQLLGKTHEHTLQAMDQLGRSYWLHGQYREALELQQTTTERMRETLGAQHPQTLAALDNLGVTLGAWRRFDESLEVHQEVLTARLSMEETFGSLHLETLTTKANITMAQLDLGQLDKAKSVMTEVFHERQKQLGKEHPWALWALCYLAKIYIEMKSYHLSDDHLGVLMGRGYLAKIYARTGRLAQAEKLTLETLRKVETARGIAHPDCVYGLWKLALLYERMGQYGKAIEACELGLRRADMRITRKHPMGKDLEELLSRLRTASTSDGNPTDDADDDVVTLVGDNGLSLKTTTSTSGEQQRRRGPTAK